MPKRSGRHSSTAVESGVEMVEHVAQVVLPYVLILVQSLSKHWGLNFVLGLGSRYDGKYRDDMTKDLSSSNPSSFSQIVTHHQEDNEPADKDEPSLNLN